MTAVFSKIAIESVKKQDIAQSLAQRKELGINPFNQGFDTMKSKTDIASIELNQIRLCFQVFIPGGDQSQYVAGPIAVSNVIKDKRIQEDLSIINISENSATVNGGKKILLFTSKISKDNIQVRFSCNHSKLLQNFIILDFRHIKSKTKFIFQMIKTTFLKETLALIMCINNMQSVSQHQYFLIKASLKKFM